jgi:hypothetical protein
MRSNRKGESGHVPFRSGRFFRVGEKWFFATREGIDHGPYESKEEAEAELTLFLRGIATANQQFVFD